MKLITAAALLACAASSANAAEANMALTSTGQQNTGSNLKTDVNNLGSDLKQGYTSVMSSHPKMASWANAATNAIKGVGNSIEAGVKNGKTFYDNAKLAGESGADARKEFVNGFTGQSTETVQGSCQIHVDGHSNLDFCVNDLSAQDCSNFANTCQFSAAVYEFRSTETGDAE